MGGNIEKVSTQYLAHIIDSNDLQWEEEEPKESLWLGRDYTTALERETKDESALVKDGAVESACIDLSTRYYTFVEWEITYKEEAKQFLEQIANIVHRIGDPDPKDIRLVMGFDS